MSLSLQLQPSLAGPLQLQLAAPFASHLPIACHAQTHGVEVERSTCIAHALSGTFAAQFNLAGCSAHDENKSSYDRIR